VSDCNNDYTTRRYHGGLKNHEMATVQLCFVSGRMPFNCRIPMVVVVIQRLNVYLSTRILRFLSLHCKT
jgi:hypothetical protein